MVRSLIAGTLEVASLGAFLVFIAALAGAGV
jgi:hypothetical protein